MSDCFAEIDLKDSIVLCRYGGILRGLQVSLFFPCQRNCQPQWSLLIFRSKEAKVSMMAAFIGIHNWISLQKVVPRALLSTQTLEMMEQLRSKMVMNRMCPILAYSKDAITNVVLPDILTALPAIQLLSNAAACNTLVFTLAIQPLRDILHMKTAPEPKGRTFL